MVFFDFIRRFLCVVVVFFLTESHSQSDASVLDEVWCQYYNTSKISEKWGLDTDVGYRLKEARFVDLSQYFLRSGLSYQLKSNVKVVLGAAYFKAHFKGLGKTSEFRIHQQINTKHKFRNIRFSNRIRVEEKYVNILKSEGNLAENSFNFRFRYRFLLDFPLFELFKRNTSTLVSVVSGNEILLSAGKNKFVDFSAQNRFLFGPAIEINDNNKFFVLFNFTSVSKDLLDISDEFGVLWIGYKQRFDFSG